MKKKNLLIIFTKNPIKGKVKTRLARDIGEENALEIYRALLKRSHDVTMPLSVCRHVYYSNAIPKEDIWNEGTFEKRLQEGEDLGERMENAFRKGFEEGFEQIVIIGTDLFEIKTSDIQNAFVALEMADYVIGPAQDGGYYLLGMKSLNSKIFKNKDWSTSSVYQDTLKDMAEGRLKVLPVLNDIDVVEDIKQHPSFQKFLINDRTN